MESVSHITSQRRHLISFIEVHHADDTVLDTPEATFVEGDTWCLVDDALTLLLAFLLFLSLLAVHPNQTGAEDYYHGGHAHDNKSPWKDEADDDSEDGQAVARVRVIAVWCEAVVRLQDVDCPCCVEYATDRLEDKVATGHCVLIVYYKEELPEDPHEGLCNDDEVKEDHVESG